MYHTQVAVLNASMSTYEDTFLHRLRKDRDDFAAVIADMAQTIQVTHYTYLLIECIIDTHLVAGGLYMGHAFHTCEVSELTCAALLHGI
jgi:hypothetical protein